MQTHTARHHIIRSYATGRLLVAAAAGTALTFLTASAGAQTGADPKFAKRVDRASQVLDELVSVPDKGPPKSLLASATCIAVVPGVVQVGLGVGGRAGFGVESCRTATGWSQPTFVGLKGGSVGFQVGAQSADVVLVFVNENAAQRSSSTFDLGAGASVAAGPIGRNASAETNVTLQSEIFSYSKSKGVFAGVSLSGTKWEIDDEANKAVYRPEGGNTRSAQALLTSDGHAGTPPLVRPFLASLARDVGPGTRVRTAVATDTH